MNAQIQVRWKALAPREQSLVLAAVQDVVQTRKSVLPAV